MADTKLLESIARRLKGSKPEQVRAIIGFDGFVDEVVYLVDKRYDKDRYDRIRYLADYGKKVCDATGLSMNIEMVPVKKKLGRQWADICQFSCKTWISGNIYRRFGKGKYPSCI